MDNSGCGRGIDRRQLIAGTLAAVLGGTASFRARAQSAAPLHASDEQMLQIVALNGVDPPLAARLLAFYSLIQHDLYIRAQQQGRTFEEAAAGLAMMVALRQLPAGLAIAEEGDPSATTVPEASEEAVMVAANLHDRRQQDGARFDAEPLCRPPQGIVWQSPFNRPPVRPGWGRVGTFLTDPAVLGSTPPPPLVASRVVLDQLDSIERRTNNASDLERDMVRRYGYPTGTITPAGYWFVQASRLAAANRLGIGEHLFIRALAMAAINDATICCWQLKYQYWYPRPSQLNPAIRPIISVPNFPSFTSGHASMSGAASRILARLLPAAAASVSSEAEDAAYSRVLGGIHFEFDSAVGLAQGRKVADSVLQSCSGATAGRTMLCELVRSAPAGDESGLEREAVCALASA